MLRDHVRILGASAFGSLFQEFLHWSTLRERLSAPAYRRFRAKTDAWFATIGMVVLSTIGAYLWTIDDTVRYPLRHLMLLGAAFPLLFKSAVAAFVKERRDAGASDDSSALKTYFQLNVRDASRAIGN